MKFNEHIEKLKYLKQCFIDIRHVYLSSENIDKNRKRLIEDFELLEWRKHHNFIKRKYISFYCIFSDETFKIKDIIDDGVIIITNGYIVLQVSCNFIKVIE